MTEVEVKMRLPAAILLILRQWWICRPQCRSSCGAEGDRTPDLVNAIHALSQLSYSPRTISDGQWRTDNAQPQQHKVNSPTSALCTGLSCSPSAVFYPMVNKIVAKINQLAYKVPR